MSTYNTKRKMDKETTKCPVCNGEGVICSCGSKVKKNWGISLSYTCINYQTTLGLVDTHLITNCSNKNCNNGRVLKTTKNGKEL